MDNILNSILYAIRDYEYYHHKTPDRILMNEICANKIIEHLQIQSVSHKNTLYGIPVNVIEDEQDTYFKLPKFWLCTEGQIVNY